MIGLALSLGYVGWAALSFAMTAHYRVLASKAPPRTLVVALRLLGAAALLASLLVCIFQWGAARGSVAWFGVLSVSGLILIALLATSNRSACVMAICLSIMNVVVAALSIWL